MSTIAGTWSLRMKTPIGTIRADYVFEEERGATRGSASGTGETTPLLAVHVEHGPDGERVTWRQRITRPLRLDLEFDVMVTGDSLVGESRAGRLPRTRVTGERISA